MSESHKEYDTDFLLHVRALDLEVKYQAGNNGRSFFSSLQIGSGANVIKRGDIIRLYPKKTKSNTLDKNSEIYGRIIAFASHKLLGSDVTTYNGKASILYVREPTMVYGDDEEQLAEMVKKDSQLPLPLSAIVLRNNTFVKVTQQELKSVSQVAVKYAKVFLIEKVGDPPVDITELSKQGIQTTKLFYEMGIQLFNGLDQHVIAPPQASNNIDKRYKVSATLYTSAGTQKNYEIVSGNQMWFYSEKEKRELEFKSKDLSHVR